MSRHAAVDLGASSGRVVVGEVSRTELVLEQVHRFPNGAVEGPDGLHWDVRGLYREALAGLAKAGPVDTVGIDSWAVDYGLVDDAGALLNEPWHYRDQRTAAVLDAVHATVSPERLYAINGLQFLPFTTLYQLAAETSLSADNHLSASTTLLLVPDLLAYWLTGERGAEITNASTTGLLDACSRTWSEELTKQFDLPVLPGLRRPGDVIGDTPHGLLVAVGSHDTASAVVGVPMEGDQAAYVSLGTWGLVGVELEQPVLTERSRAANFTNELGVDDRIRYLRNVMGLWLLQECLRAWSLTSADLPGLLEQAAAVPPQPVFDVDDPRLVAPGDMPARLATLLDEAGHPPATSRAQLVRYVVDSLAAALSRTVREAAALSGRDVAVIHVVGGGAQIALLCQLLASTSGLPVIAGPVEATAVGNLLVQARAHGTLSGDLDDLRALVRRTHQLATYQP